MHLHLPSKIRCEYLCPGCGHRVSVEFVDPDAISEPEPLPSSSRLAAEHMWRTAEVALEKRARRALTLVRCPSCQMRDARSLRRAYRRAVLPLVAIAPMVFMVSVIATALRAPWVIRGAPWIPVAVGCGVLAVLGPLVVWRAHRRLIREADQAIRFLPTSGAKPS